MRFLGNRIVKTAVAVFLTALICQLIGWPPVFAVITAIVTLEPTVSDSIKKGIVRFPASAIGSFFAVLFIFLFGNSPVTFTLAATLTIITCYRLKLHDGLLVATITAVAMVEVVYDNYFMSFFIRLGTTTIGITVSTLVNLLILPPNFMKDIEKNLQYIYFELGNTLSSLLLQDKKLAEIKIEEVNNLIVKTEQLVRYEVSDVEYFKLEDDKQSQLDVVKKELDQLRFIHYHINNLHDIKLNDTNLNEIEKNLIIESVDAIANVMIGKTTNDLEANEQQLRNIMKTYWTVGQLPKHSEMTTLPTELVLLYELLSIVYLVNNIRETTEGYIEKETST